MTTGQENKLLKMMKKVRFKVHQLIDHMLNQNYATQYQNLEYSFVYRNDTSDFGGTHFSQKVHPLHNLLTGLWIESNSLP